MDKTEEMNNHLIELRRLSQEMKKTVTPEFIRSLDPQQAAWIKEHLEMLMIETRVLGSRINSELKRRANRCT